MIARSGARCRLTPLATTRKRVDVEAAVGLVENGEARLQHRHLEDLVALLLAAGKPDIDRALQQVLADVEILELGAHDAQELPRVKFGFAAVATAGVERGAQEIHVVHAGDFDRVLEGEKEPLARPLVGRHRQEVAAEIGHRALADFIAFTAGEYGGQRRFARAVRPHDRVHFAGRDRQVDPLQYFAAVRQPRMQTVDFEH